MTRNLGKIRKDYTLFHRLTFGGLFYWLLLKNKSSFKLTSNPIMRFAFIFTCFSNMLDMASTEGEYICNTVFMNNKMFEGVIDKYQLKPAELNKL